ncbi:phosphoribosylanthranilate isomerase [Salibacterium salarium]|uniref:N-(5'-phosphoribosyl)anthranilate isomerase n=1 Tax=Salibacterium salarium TaxID=284579 RepID=A0A3R9PLH9_9BACI|nr:phosphoribosylanthranilate isomerase [Salibacterium salarium]RSL33456.1 phosphoribosylanthranilate isomerase [Salibacterium salarium]
MSLPFLKLCGLHSQEDVKVASYSSADFVGFVMAESKRQVKPEEAESWLRKHPLDGKKTVTLFVNAPLSDIQTAVNQLSPDIIQCHGTESIEDILKIKQATGKLVWKAIPHDDRSLDKMKAYADVVDGFVIDAKVKDAWGGTGRSFDWSHVPKYVSFGEDKQLPVLIAGGIAPENVDHLMPHGPWGIDLSSGIEKDGKKDIDRLMELEKRLK